MNRRITRETKMLMQARNRKGLSQQQVAALIGIHVRQYQRLEYGESDILKLGLRPGLSLCVVLGLDPLELVFGAAPEALDDIRNRCAEVKKPPQ